ncbi:cAMP-binding domain of CRP or a regulatory subunit of cAMP-dependent protein kinases [Catalinimonas alkaloidigena]|uniref:cAMP-binding domain of CRP or a regulatory subunit of cAMP-dependent protein kinases n=1 Tax=Catalinimonas alkaloidigena TaxID=1075417 RepID=A0A1G9QCN5_9BACT|nr:cyclic nucleotide-binding domain-containing protein [Catalinimonas alkaloidigena]SDM08237.1 cAMP-binding domain of CRP or a regulatory subunit of cAMP-dependent protein kinases [Catalinimonas alkaloidigena]
MRYLANLNDLLNLRKGEVWVVRTLLLFSFFQTTALALFFTAASSLFLTEYPIRTLAYVYLSTGLLLLFLNGVYARITRFVPARTLMLAEVGVILVVILLFRIGMGWAHAAWLAFGLIVWHRVMSSYLSAGFLRLALLLFDVRQSKRLFGLITSAETPASVLGYLLASALVPLIGTPNLLWWSAGALLGALVFLALLTTRPGTLTFEETSTEAEAAPPVSLFRRGKGRLGDFLAALALTCVFAVLTFTLIEFAFLSQVSSRFTNQSQITFFIGIILAMGQFAAFLLKTFLYGQVQRRFGLRAALLALPLVLGLIMASSLLSGLVGPTLLLVWLWVVIMVANDTLRSSLYSNTFIALLQPLPRRMKMLGLDLLGNVEAAAVGLSGLVLVGFGLLDALSLQYFSGFLLVVLVGWVAAIRVLNRRYLRVLEQGLKKRLLAGHALSVEDPATLRLIHEKLDSPYPGEVLYALDILSKHRHGQLPQMLKRLLVHPSEEVRQEALAKVDALRQASLLPEIKKRMEQETVLALKKQALRVYCKLGEATVVDEVTPYLEATDEPVRTGALVGLICSGGIDGVIVAGQRLNDYIYATQPEKRAFAADVIGEVGIYHFYHPLLGLLDDEDVVVRKAALKAAGIIRHPRLYEPLLQAVSSPDVFEVAMNALIQSGEGVIGLFERELNQADYNPVRMRRLIAICGKVGGAKSIALLKDKLYFENIEVRNQILHSLSLCGYKPNAAEKEVVLRTLHAELADAAWFLNAMEAIGLASTAAQLPYYALLIRALEVELHHLKRRLLLLLSFLYEANDVLQVWNSLQLTSREKRANALEVLDVLVAKELSSIILPLLEDFPIAQQIKILNPRFPHVRLSPTGYLQKLINRREVPVVNVWTQAVTLYVVRQLQLEALTAEVMGALSHPTSLVAETACWTLQGFQHDRLPENGASVLFQKLAQNAMNSRLLAVEKVMALKTTRLLSETPEDILVDIASILKEVPVVVGEQIVQKGEIGTCMYIIYEGSVRVHDGEHTLAELKNRDFFGELSLLDAEPRSASVTALEDSFLLRLDQHAFYEIMADHIEVTREIMKIMCRRLRYQNRAVAEMKEQLQQRAASALEKPA